MLICPGCKTILKRAPKSGTCPKCGHPIVESGTATGGPQGPTLELTADLESAEKSAPTFINCIHVY